MINSTIIFLYQIFFIDSFQIKGTDLTKHVEQVTRRTEKDKKINYYSKTSFRIKSAITLAKILHTIICSMKIS